MVLAPGPAALRRRRLARGVRAGAHSAVHGGREAQVAVGDRDAGVLSGTGERCFALLAAQSVAAAAGPPAGRLALRVRRAGLRNLSLVGLLKVGLSHGERWRCQPLMNRSVE